MPSSSVPLPPTVVATVPVDRALLAAQGYSELGMPAEALNELAAISEPGFHRRADVLQLRLLLHLQARQWEPALEQSLDLCRTEPRSPEGFIHAAFCLHELGRTTEAKTLLMGGPASLLRDATYHYNLGCYDAVLGNLEEAQVHLRASFQIDAKFRNLAKVDPDLKDVWELL